MQRPCACVFHLSCWDNQSSCQIQWKVDVIGFFWLHQAEITEAVSVHRWCFFTQSGLSHQLPSSLLYFILIKSPNISFTIPKPSTKVLGSFMFSLLCFYLPHTSVTTWSHWKPQFPSFKKKKCLFSFNFKNVSMFLENPKSQIYDGSKTWETGWASWLWVWPGQE